MLGSLFLKLGAEAHPLEKLISERQVLGRMKDFIEDATNRKRRMTSISICSFKVFGRWRIFLWRSSRRICSETSTISGTWAWQSVILVLRCWIPCKCILLSSGQDSPVWVNFVINNQFLESAVKNTQNHQDADEGPIAGQWERELESSKMASLMATVCYRVPFSFQLKSDPKIKYIQNIQRDFQPFHCFQPFIGQSEEAVFSAKAVSIPG